jgi:hypothetical protein
MYNEYYEGFSLLNKKSKAAGVTTSDVALQIIANNVKSIQDYVRRGGNIPETDLLKLSVQAGLTHENAIAKKMRLENISYEAAEKKVLAEENRKQYFSGEDEQFLGLTLAAITDLAKKGIAKINEVRNQKGKKPLLSGKFWQKLKSKGEKAGLELKQTDEGKISLSANLPSTTGKQTEVGAGLEAIGTELESQKKKEFFKKNMIWIILGAVVLIGGVIYLARKK